MIVLSDDDEVSLFVTKKEEEELTDITPSGEASDANATTEDESTAYGLHRTSRRRKRSNHGTLNYIKLR